MNSSKFTDIEVHVQTFIGRTMYIDAGHFITRSKLLLKQDYTDRSWCSKIYVDLLLAIESDLKCIIIYLPTTHTSLKDLYKKARECSHNIPKLYSLAKTSLKDSNHKALLANEEDLLINKFSKITINNRYELENIRGVRIDIKEGDFSGGNTKHLLDTEGLDQLLIIACSLHEISGKLHENRQLIALTGDSIVKYHDELDKFLTLK